MGARSTLYFTLCYCVFAGEGLAIESFVDKLGGGCPSQPLTWHEPTPEEVGRLLMWHCGADMEGGGRTWRRMRRLGADVAASSWRYLCSPCT